MFERLGWAAVPLGYKTVSDVLQICDAHPTRPEAASSKVAEDAEEGGSMRQFRTRSCRICYFVEQLPLLCRTAVGKIFVEFCPAPVIDPCQSSTHGGLSLRLIDHHEIHKLGNTGFARASGAF